MYITKIYEKPYNIEFCASGLYREITQKIFEMEPKSAISYL